MASTGLKGVYSSADAMVKILVAPATLVVKNACILKATITLLQTAGTVYLTSQSLILLTYESC